MLLIDNVPISKFKAKLLSRKIRPAKLTNSNFWNKGSLIPFIDDKFIESYKDIDLEFDMICKNANELEVMKSNIINKIKKSVLKFNDIDFNYLVCLANNPDVTYTMHGNETLKIKLLGYCFKDEIIEYLNKVFNKEIINSGNLNTPALVEIVPSIDIIDLKLEGLSDDPIIIRNLKQNKKIIIDGIKGTITQEGINKFEDTDMWEFPFLIPGSNRIKFSTNSCNITIKYNPRFI